MLSAGWAAQFSLSSSFDAIMQESVNGGVGVSVRRELHLTITEVDRTGLETFRTCTGISLSLSVTVQCNALEH